jgi:hypothetical protein
MLSPSPPVARGYAPGQIDRTSWYRPRQCGARSDDRAGHLARRPLGLVAPCGDRARHLASVDAMPVITAVGTRAGSRALEPRPPPRAGREPSSWPDVPARSLPRPARARSAHVPRTRTSRLLYEEEPIADPAGGPMFVEGGAFLRVAIRKRRATSRPARGPRGTGVGRGARGGPDEGGVVREVVGDAIFEGHHGTTSASTPCAPCLVERIEQEDGSHRVVIDVFHEEPDPAPLADDPSTEPREEAGDPDPQFVHDVRVGTHDGFDRGVVEHSGRTPVGWRAAYGDDARARDVLGLEEPGEVVLEITTRDITPPTSSPTCCRPGARARSMSAGRGHRAGRCRHRRGPPRDRHGLARGAGLPGPVGRCSAVFHRLPQTGADGPRWASAGPPTARPPFRHVTPPGKTPRPPDGCNNLSSGKARPICRLGRALGDVDPSRRGSPTPTRDGGCPRSAVGCPPRSRATVRRPARASGCGGEATGPGRERRAAPVRPRSSWTAANRLPRGHGNRLRPA